MTQIREGGVVILKQHFTNCALLELNLPLFPPSHAGKTRVLLVQLGQNKMLQKTSPNLPFQCCNVLFYVQKEDKLYKHWGMPGNRIFTVSKILLKQSSQLLKNLQKFHLFI